MNSERGLGGPFAVHCLLFTSLVVVTLGGSLNSYRLLADVVVGLHFLFVLFVTLGGLLALRWPRVTFVHIPAAVWGAAIEFGGWICPLTPLEHWLRRQAGDTAYAGGFIEQYILPILYPSALTRGVQIFLGLFVLTVNLLVYGYLIRRRRHLSSASSSTSPSSPASPSSHIL